jgi:hypothetical protein
MTSKDVPPALIVLGANVLDTCGRLKVTVSESATVQTPPIQAVVVFVLTTVAGAVIDAVFVIWVCAPAFCKTPRASITPNTSTNALTARTIELSREIMRRRAVDTCNEFTSTFCYIQQFLQLSSLMSLFRIQRITNMKSFDTCINFQ